jgi:ribosomal protein S12 methylthiotransferase accessory factor
MDYASAPELDVLARSSNGLASGNTLAEALAAALFEVLERDALATFHGIDARTQDQFRVRRAALRTGPAGALVRAVDEAGLWLDAWDATGPIGVPVFHAVVSEEGEAATFRVPQAAGAGCHLDPGVALCRAVTEALQSRLAFISGVRDDIDPDLYTSPPVPRAPRISAALFADAAARPFVLPDCSGASSGEDVAILLERLAAIGIRSVAAVDLTRPEIGLPVVRAVVPGLAVPTASASYRAGTHGGSGTSAPAGFRAVYKSTIRAAS